MTEFTPVSTLAGGAIIGLAAVLLLKLNGRIAGISGIMSGVLLRKDDWPWRLAFVLGLLAAGFVYTVVSGEPLVTRESFSRAQLLVAGVLVGFGTRLGSGCTSGHGVCGIARLSRRSLVATGTFVLIGVATATLVYSLRTGA